MKSYVKIYGPPLLKAIKALEKIAIDMPQVCIMDPLIMRENLFASDVIATQSTRMENVLTYFEIEPERMDSIRCDNIISKSGDTLGDYDFFFEWFKQPDKDQVQMLIEKIDEALADLGVKYTLTTK
ncbi:hypothetical protein JW865_06245 [Candidatus Bathyarchaeota archaeon]|nr:hypothetical protein [Candidatus Bathyarchaeota archaeon]